MGVVVVTLDRKEDGLSLVKNYSAIILSLNCNSPKGSLFSPLSNHIHRSHLTCCLREFVCVITLKLTSDARSIWTCLCHCSHFSWWKKSLQLELYRVGYESCKPGDRGNMAVGIDNTVSVVRHLVRGTARRHAGRLCSNLITSSNHEIFIVSASSGNTLLSSTVLSLFGMQVFSSTLKQWFLQMTYYYYYY